MRIIKQVLTSNPVSSNQSQKRDAFAGIMGEYDRQADSLQTQMVDTAHRGLFDPEFLNPIQERWMRLDETLKLHFDLCDLYGGEDEPFLSRRSLTWPEVRSLVQVDDVGTKRDDKLGQIQLASRPRKATEPDTTAGSKVANAFILWLVVFSCAVAPAALFALGYSRSLHLQGTVNDADFWFLIQATLVQIQGLVVSALLERKRGRLPRWRWAIPAAIAGACSIVAIPLYLTVPRDWSSFLSLVAGTTQSFMILQLFLF
ncbi:hypothetical protein BU23DRAFT_564322 [Bimuria novae-zelandiae CBS 107.79]|uniref:Uncharacterized protein n=1 Tax=Bimuria novae-zelandiae CBS 107.79 TaxID=1447943 RepID=A0A6A5VT36_9PLEO|nr:hypothetical protein BU23DRAFT_564322 [Bimuria novae-zelandiae CBS 107.79]